MNNSIHRISLDIHDTGSQVSISAKKRDTARSIYITLTENGKPYKIAEDCYAVLTGVKSDKNYLFNDCTIKDNVIIYDFTEQTVPIVGQVHCEITLYDTENEKITSPRFDIVVDDVVYNDEEIVSSKEANALITAIAEAKAITAEVEQKLANGEFVGEKGDKGDKGDTSVVGPESPDGTSVIMGDLENNFAGTKAFRILSGNAAEKSYVLDSVEGLEGFEKWPEEDRYLSFYVVAPDGNSSHRNDNNIRLVGVDTANNKIYTSSFYAGWPVSGFGEGSYLRVIAHPELGTFWAELYAFAAGQNNKALGDGAFAVGMNNLANGAYSFAAGRNNMVQYCSMAYGRFNEVPAQLSIALGQYNKLRGHNSIGLGCGLQTNETNQIAVGRYNLPDKNMLLMLGNGADENNRNNLFGLSKDGSLYIDGQKVVISLGKKVYSLPDIGEFDKIYCLKGFGTYENYIFLQTEHKVGRPWDGSIASEYAYGNGSRSTPYIIETPEQFARMVNSFGEDKYYELANDIYLNDVSDDKWYESGGNRSWFEAADNNSFYQYISTSGTKGTFAGHINGNGHIVYGLYYNDSSIWGGGLIPTISNGSVENLGIDKCYVSVGNEAGALAATTGRGASGTVNVESCYVGKDTYMRATKAGGAAAGFFAYATTGIVTNIRNSYCLSTQITAQEIYKANAFIGQTWKSPYTLAYCYSILRPFNSWNVKERVSSLVNWTYNGATVSKPVDKTGIYDNVFSEDKSELHSNEYTLLDNQPLFTQVDDLINDDYDLGRAFFKNNSYPALKINMGDWVKL